MSEQCRDHGVDEAPWMCECTHEAFNDLRTSVIAALFLLPKDCNGKQLLEEALPKANRVLNCTAKSRFAQSGKTQSQPEGNEGA